MKTIEVDDAKRRVVITVGAHNCFRYEEFQWLEPWEEDGEFLDEGYWNCTHFSGLYAKADETEADARRSLPWLRAASEQTATTIGLS